MIPRPPLGAVAAIAVVAAVALVAQAARASRVALAEPLPTAQPRQGTAEDTLAVTRFLAAVRGADPVLCELASRSVDGRGWWSNWGGVSGRALEIDSSSAAVLRWTQADRRDPALVPRLAAALRDGDRCVRRVAGALLARTRHDSAVDALIAAIGEPAATTRSAAAIGLGIADAHRAVDALIRLLRDGSPEVRRSAAWALGAIEDKSAMLPLIQVLETDGDAGVRQAAAWAIGQVTG